MLLVFEPFMLDDFKVAYSTPTQQVFKLKFQAFSKEWRASPPRIAYFLTYIIFKTVGIGLRLLPIAQAANLSAFFWRLIAPKLYRHRRANDNLMVAMPELSEEERDIVLKGVWDNLGRTSAEVFRLNEIADDPNSLSYHFSASVVKILNSEQSAVFVSLHAGNWEIPALVAERFGKPLIGLYKRVENPLINAYVLHLRARFYRGGLLSRDPETVRRILSGVKQGYSVAIMADLRDTRGDFVPFFGIPSRSTTFPATLARLHDLPIVAIRAIRTSPGRFRVDAEEIPVVVTANRKFDIRENTKRIQAQLEKWVRDDPASWMWGNRRWSSEHLDLHHRSRNLYFGVDLDS